MGIKELREHHPWPASRPALPSVQIGWPNPGFNLALSKCGRDAHCILEVGSLFGSTARQWAAHAPGAAVICVDPWWDFERPIFNEYPQVGQLIRGRQDGAYELFLSSCWEARGQIIPVRGTSPAALVWISECNVHPDLIYLDGDHEFKAIMMDLMISRELFPDAVLCGDDWSFDSVRYAVEKFCGRHNYSVEFEMNTWALTKRRSPQ